MDSFLNQEELRQINERFPDGIASQEIVKIFQSHNIRFSEATFRKYVQMGLVERCRRVGQKGKHRGSRGLYPITTIERINSIKRMISGDMTLEQLQGSYFAMRQKMEEVERILGTVSKDIENQEVARQKAERQDVRLRHELEIIFKNVRRFIEALEKLESAFLA